MGKGGAAPFVGSTWLGNMRPTVCPKVLDTRYGLIVWYKEVSAVSGGSVGSNDICVPSPVKRANRSSCMAALLAPCLASLRSAQGLGERTVSGRSQPARFLARSGSRADRRGKAVAAHQSLPAASCRAVGWRWRWRRGTWPVVMTDAAQYLIWRYLNAAGPVTP